MSILLTDEQAALAALYSRGEELQQRYRESLNDAELPAGLRRCLHELYAARVRMLAELADAQRADGLLPKAGNSERAALEALGDHLMAVMSKEDAVSERLRRADRAWLAEVRDARALEEWSPSEMELLERLADHLRLSDALLGSIGE